MGIMDVKSAVAEIEATKDMLERALKLSGLITTMFQQRGFSLVVVGGSAVEFYTEGGYMSGDIDFCRRSLNAIPPRVMQESPHQAAQRPPTPRRGNMTPWALRGAPSPTPPPPPCSRTTPRRSSSPELTVTAKKMMVAAMNDPHFDWNEAERLAALPDFGVLAELRALKEEVSRG